MADLTRPPLLDLSGFPRELYTLPRWVTYNFQKRPFMPDSSPASVTVPATWSVAKDVLRAIDEAPPGTIIGPGIVLGDLGDGRTLSGFDIDACRNPETGELDAIAAAIIDSMLTYSEASASGTGVHVLFFGNLPEGRRRHRRVEAYDSARFFTLSGVRIGNTATIEPREREAAIVHAVYVAEPEPTKERSTRPGVDLTLSDLDLVAKAIGAKNGAKVARPLDGDRTGYASPSEADAAAVACLGYWTRDPEQVERIIRNSGLYRESKDRRNRGYYQHTVARIGGAR